MVTKTKSTISGFESFDKLLNNLGPRIGNKVLQGAVLKAARAGARIVKQAAPRSIDEKSPASKLYGPISRNIKVKRLRKVARGERGARIDTGKAFWAVFYQFGTRHQAARPWFDQAFARANSTMIEILAKEIGSGIEKEALKLKGKS